MRKMVLLLSAAALTLAGCNGQPPPASPGANNPAGPKPVPAAGATAPIPNQVSGTVKLHEPAQLSDQSQLEISLLDVTAGATSPGQAVATKNVKPATQFPLDFQLSFDPAQIKRDDLYVVKATLVDGDRQYTMPIQAPVLTKGGPDKVTIELISQQTPGEVMLAKFNTAKADIGAMKITNGTQLEKSDSRSWQVFRQAGEIKMILELVDYNEKRFTKTYYAYADGKPWVAVQETMATSNGKPTSTDRAGWDENGDLVLKQHESGSKTGELSAGAAKSLQEQALAIMTLATGGKNK
ncbi:MAG: YbaY family lipoprotein [Rhodanobacter sp.]